ncbi:MAG: RtcB family protein [Bacillota bacterium]
MITIFDRSVQRVPIKAWLESADDIESGAMAQALNLSRLPFLVSHVALMPDVHEGYGMPIGGVIAAKGAVIPNAVGVDIGCGLIGSVLDAPAKLLREVKTGSGTLAQALTGDIMRAIPLGFEHRKRPIDPEMSPTADMCEIKSLCKEWESAPYQCGTLGGGNHFIELPEDGSTGELVIMVHSGSRNFGYKVANTFNNLAKKLNEQMKSEVPASWQLAYLPTEHELGRMYLKWMDLALRFAAKNRSVMMQIATEIVQERLSKHASVTANVRQVVQCHHNYASIERHYGEEVVVHRKGAIRAKKGEKGIIPGAMGGKSYFVEGLGNPESFESASHGAGRVMSRNEAKRRFTVDQMMRDLSARDVVLGTPKSHAVVDEFIEAYKDIDEVLAYERDLVKPIRTVRPIAVIKG